MKFNFAELREEYEKHKKYNKTTEENTNLNLFKIIKNVIKEDINFYMCKNAYESQFIEHGSFGALGKWPYIPESCQSRKVSGISQLNRIVLDSLIAHELPNCLLDDSSRVVVLPTEFNFDPALEDKRQHFVKQEEEKITLASLDMADTLIEEARKIDMKWCFIGYKNFYIYYGHMAPKVSHAMTPRMRMPSKVSSEIIQSKLSSVDPFLKFESFGDRCWAFIEPGKFQ